MKNFDKFILGLFIFGTALLVVSVFLFKFMPFALNVTISVLEGVTALTMLGASIISHIKNKNTPNDIWYSNRFQVIFFSIILVGWAIAAYFVM